ncbi:MAG: acetyl-CoA hydrolase/transferase family protein [Saprospiraceae bacterium]|nr:acetyl-CoA hydrolase/transferase family protein [Saprospiraceae bacterium]MBK6785321.1 acetyl-CoA hydrolase/transferase family protein [Saprospiraceae bacterium]MBK8369854.1 acetyl-CoA hydrolase/transferase family protein [Saprospiraceae bacterium]MBK8548224.1 acetyl-CoA hydrolase/transferase family protein [Saprospiraceae bacterium]MBK8819213.1 acetyl-CoA hydrolase/transferase family protein [Saprospiraceae bacterium]
MSYSYQHKIKTADEAVRVIQSGNRIIIQGSAATPLVLTEALGKRAGELLNVEIICISLHGDLKLIFEEYPKSFYFNALFVSANLRQVVNDERGDYVPVFLSEISKLFKHNYLPVDVVLLHCSPPDKNGFCSLGVSVDIIKSAALTGKYIIAQINKKMPRTHGDSFIHVDDINVLVEVDQDLPEVSYSSQINDSDKIIAGNCASLIDDKATLQMGIGNIPDAVLKELLGHKDLGIHTEMFSDGILDLIDKGVITNKFKKKHRDKIVSSFAIGSRKLYDFIDDNPMFEFLESEYVNSSDVISKNPKVVALNSAIQIDLTGQVCSDSIGTYQYSGVGGQMDFMRGAALSEKGKPIIAMPSITSKGESKICPFLHQGAGVVTTRAHVHYVITEYGITNLFGKNLKQRAYALIDIAHPDHREMLDKAAFERFGSKII